MDVIAFDVGAPRDAADPATAEITLRINGRATLDLVREAELPGATAEGRREHAGRSMPAGTLNPTRYAVRDSRHFLGEPVLTWFRDGDTGVLGCTCGDFGCSPVTVDIWTGPQSVRWSHFRIGHRDGDLSALGPSSSTGTTTTRGGLRPVTHARRAACSGAPGALPDEAG